MAKTPQPSYRVIKREGPFQIRAYEAMVLAEVTVDGPREEATDDGFRILASYLLGNNDKNEKMQMMIPVTFEPYDTRTGKSWTVRFIMPPGRSIDGLPRPDDANIALFDVPVGRAAVIRFSGRATNAILKKQAQALKDWLKKEQLKPSGPPTYAFYNSPMTLPFLRRNEVMVGIEY